jgi:hypothetical protein
MLGEGPKVIGFIPEFLLTSEHLEGLRSDNPVQAELVERALRNLPKLKAEVAARRAQHSSG